MTGCPECKRWRIEYQILLDKIEVLKNRRKDDDSETQILFDEIKALKKKINQESLRKSLNENS